MNNLIGKYITKDATNVKIGDKHEVALKFAQCDDDTLRKELGDDIPDGYIAGYASTPDLDLGLDVVMPGAFDESIAEKGLRGPKGIKLLLNHDWSKMAGKIMVLETRNGKLWIEAQLNLDITYVRDAYLAAKDVGGVSFSVGFRIQEYTVKEDDDGNFMYLQIDKGKLSEVSMVPFPMNEEATMNFIKQENSSSLVGVEAKSISEFEKALVASGLVESRNKAREISNYLKDNIEIFTKEATRVVDSKPKQSLVSQDSMKKLQDQLNDLKKTLENNSKKD